MEAEVRLGLAVWLWGASCSLRVQGVDGRNRDAGVRGREQGTQGKARHEEVILAEEDRGQTGIHQ